MAIGLQLVGLFFGLSMIYYTFLHFKRNEFGRNVFLLWIVIWFAFIVVMLFPSFLDPVITALRFNRIFDFFTVVGFIFVIVLSFYNFTVVKRNENKIESLVRKIALSDAKGLNKKKKK